MKLASEFYKLPLNFDAERLAREINSIAENEWRAHPQGYEGNSAMVLISNGGGQNDDMSGTMLPTALLKKCPYIRQVLAAFDTVIGRSRLMRLAPHSEVSSHTDIHHYWRNRTRIHVPIITDPSVSFCCNGKTVHMAAGEAWIFDNWRQHNVINRGDITRIHLVADTTGSATFWGLVKSAEKPFGPRHSAAVKSRFIPYDPDADPALITEQFSKTPVLPPSEIDTIVMELLEDVYEDGKSDDADIESLHNTLETLRHEWRSLWSLYGDGIEGHSRYQALIEQTLSRVRDIPGPPRLAINGARVLEVLRKWLESAVASKTKSPKKTESGVTGKHPHFERPVFIVAGPRSGSTLLFETLANNRGLWTLGGESHAEFENIPALNLAHSNYHSNRLTVEDASVEVKAALIEAFINRIQDSQGKRYLDYSTRERLDTLRFLEKTPKNALRIPFLREVFPDALFIYLHRNARDNISSIIDAWRSEKFVTYPDLPGWNGPPWSLLLPPGWRELDGTPIEKVAAFQWKTANQQILDDLSELTEADWCSVNYEALLADPATSAERLCDFIGIPFGKRMKTATADTLPNSRYTLTTPDPNKWLKNETEVMSVIADVEDIERQLAAL